MEVKRWEDVILNLQFFERDPDLIAKRETHGRSKSNSRCMNRDADTWGQLHTKSQVCCHTAAYFLLLPSMPVFVSETETSCRELWLGSSAVHEKCIGSTLFLSLFASDTLVISYPCHVSVCINYVAGAVEETILMHLNETSYVYYSPSLGNIHKT